MPRPGSLSASRFAEARVKAGAIAADSATLTDANLPPAEAFDCRGYQTVWIGVEITGGTNSTATVEVLVRDEDAPDGARWKRLLVGAPEGVTATSAASAKTPALDGTSLYEVRVEGRRVFFRIDAVTNSAGTTGLKVLAMPGKPRADLNRWS
jgi:hypothetical protein